MLDSDVTIVAIATPPGHGGVGILRISGQQALAIGKKITQKSELKPRYAYFAACHDENMQVIDQGVVIYFKAPHSYTGEDTVELQVHGSPWVLAELIRVCQVFGARQARPGEFTERAFLNNKIDLVQAEAVADLIHAQSAMAARMATRTLQGKFSEAVEQIDNDLTKLRMFVESTIDFADEALEWLEDYQWQSMLTNIILQVQKIKKQAFQGQVLQEGLTLVMVGRPNVGKSTLMNVLAQKEVAIVTPIAGTTRDLMRERVLMDEIPLTLIDTAGLRQTDDLIEQEGIKRAWQALEQADLLLFLHDASQKDWQQDDLPQDILETLPSNTPILHVLNKSDEAHQNQKVLQDAIAISAKTGLGIEHLKAEIKARLGIEVQESDFIARKRHVLIFEELATSLEQAMADFLLHHAPELLAEDLRYAHELLGKITGEFTADDLLGEIFSHFCIGK
jgi:tRNA modification GTPase